MIQNAITRNSGNILSGITPTFAGWDVNPGTAADIVNELTNTLTTAGNQSNNTESTITYDLGTSIRFVISALRSSAASSETMIIYISDDNVNYYPCAFNVAGTTERAVSGMGKARYIQVRFSDSATGNDITSLFIRAYRI